MKTDTNTAETHADNRKRNSETGKERQRETGHGGHNKEVKQTTRPK